MVNKYIKGIAFVLLMMSFAVLIAMAAAPDITITVTNPPANGSTINGTSFEFIAEVNDNVENIVSVEFSYKNTSDSTWTMFNNSFGTPLLNGTLHTLKAPLDTTSLANGDYQLNVTVVDNSTSDNIKSDISTYFTISNAVADTTPPNSITDLHNTTYEPTYINWTWVDPPDDSDFSKVMIYLDGTFVGNVTKGLQLYSATGLNPDTEYNISTQTVDTSGNINSTWVNHSTRTALPDTTPPNSITDLHNTTYEPTYINWTWVDPPDDSDFSKVMVYIDGTFKGNVTKGLQFYNASGLSSDTEYSISTQTVDTSGNTNLTWVNHSARTKIPPPNITYYEPTSTTLERTQGQSLLFLVKADQDVTVRWYKNDSEIKNETVNAGEEANFTFTDSPGTYIITANASNANGSATRDWTFTVHSKTYQTGNRVWDATKGMSNTYTWNPYSFSGFYYNLDSDLGTENLQIKNIDRNLGQGDVIYTTSPQEVNFTYSRFGKYQVIGFMAEKYFAGYTSNTNPPGPTTAINAVSALATGQLHQVLLDDKDKRTISEGGTFTLKEGYVLQIKAVDVGAGPGQIWYVLLKDGSEVDQGTLAGDQTYVYEASRVGGVSDLPIIFVHFTNVFRGREINAAFIEGVFQISDSPTYVKSGDRKGVMEVTSVDESQITMTNENTIDLSAGVTRDLMGNLKITVADNSSVLRFGLTTDISGSYELRGTIYDATDEWTPMNFGLNSGDTNIGFYYDIDGDVGNEKLKIANNLSGQRQIAEDGLVYTTSPQEVDFKYSRFGSYQVIGFMAKKYFAGYTSGTQPPSPTSTVDAVSALAASQIHEVLLDDKDKRTVSEGGTVTLKEGYVLQIKAVDVGAGPGQIWYVLLKDGSEVDQGTLAGDQTYVYKPDRVGGVSDLPIIFVHFTSVFRGREINAAFIEGVFQISEDPTSVKSGDTRGNMEVTSVDSNQITMKNKGTISLSSSTTSDVMGDIKFKVADSNTLRFYPFVAVTENMIANQLVITAPAKASAGDVVNIKVTAGGDAVGNASLSIDSTDAGQTDSNGILNYTLPKTLKGNYNITATKLGYQKATRGIEIQQYIEYRLSMEVPAKANQFETIAIKVTYNGTAVSGATVTYDNTTIGTTDSNGILNYKLETSGTHTVSASKTRYITVDREIEVRAPYTEYKALDINVTPEVIFSGQKYLVRSNITNVGTKADMQPIVLIVNGSVESSTNVTIDPGKTQEINFTQEMRLPKGNYTIEVLSQKKTVEVKEEPLNYLLIGGLATGLGAVIIYVLTAKSKISLAALKSKLNMEAVKGLLPKTGKKGI